MSERSGVRKQSEQHSASEQVSSASKQANEQAGGPVCTSEFLVVLDHSVIQKGLSKGRRATEVDKIPFC